MNSKELERIDSEKMYEVYDKWPQTAKEGYEMNLEKFNVKDVDHIVFAGMGGSGTIGDVMSSLLSKDDINVVTFGWENWFITLISRCATAVCFFKICFTAYSSQSEALVPRTFFFVPENPGQW